MSRAVAIGDHRRLQGFALAGVDVRPVEGSEAALAEWDRLGPDVGLLILTPDVATALETSRSEREDVVWVTLPE